MIKVNETFNNMVNYIEAEYREQIVYDYKNNPLIEALPSIITQEETIDLLANYPYFNEEERKLDKNYRCHLVQRIFQYFQPLNIHLDLYNRFSLVIRQGYISRNPIDLDYANMLNQGYDAILKSNINLNNNIKFRSSASGFTIVGVSGMGKTTTVNRILETIPQVILHSKYKEKRLCMYQITWVKLECPFDGSIKALCLDFFAKIDSIIGTKYFDKYGNGRLSINTMIPIMAQICRNVNLGMLIIDEIQNLSSAKSGGAENMLNYFLTLVNSVGLPVILIGTPNAIEIIQSQFRLARRNSAMGALFWEKLEKDKNWDLLIEGMWEYQWTKDYTPLTEELNDALYDESQGIIDIAVKLYAMAQIKAISSSKSEKVTVNLIKKISKENMKLVKPMLDALKTGNINKIAKYEDITIIDVDSFIQKETNKIEMENRIEKLREHREKNKETANKNTRLSIIEKLSILNVDLEKANKYIDVIFKDNNNVNVEDVIKEVLKKILIDEEKTVVVTRKVKRKTDSNDLRYIVKCGKEQNLNAYGSLNESNIIRNYNDFGKEAM